VARTRLILIEGLPGSGKTSLAEWLCAHVEAQGTSASWIPELLDDHPVADRSLMRTAKANGYADRCVERWAAFSREVQALDSPHLFILEGCLFQSTVRFLIEYERSAEEVHRYLPAVEDCLAPLRPHLVYLTQTNATAYLQSEVTRRKGEEIVARIARYSATTPFSVARGLEGSSALVALYARYRNTCDQLVRSSRLPVLEVDAVRFDEAAVRDQVSPWVAAALAG
jgi:hypothetical protein